MNPKVCKCGTVLIPFKGYGITQCRCCAGAKTPEDLTLSVHLEVRKMALSDTDKNIGAKVGLSPHRVYVIRKRPGIRKYRTDNYVRPTRRAVGPVREYEGCTSI